MAKHFDQRSVAVGWQVGHHRIDMSMFDRVTAVKFLLESRCRVSVRRLGRGGAIKRFVAQELFDRKQSQLSIQKSERLDSI